jgi:hypothetical protein
MWYDDPKIKEIKAWIDKHAIASPPFTFLININDLVSADFTFERIDEVLRGYYNYFSSIVQHQDDTCIVRFYYPITSMYNPYNDGNIEGDNPYNIIGARSTEDCIVCWTTEDALRLVRAALSRYAHHEHVGNSWEYYRPVIDTEGEALFTQNQALRMAYMAIMGVVPNGHYSDNECCLWSSFKRLFFHTKVGMIND